MQDNQREVELKYAYIAGLLDGEGTFCISKSCYKSLRKSPCFTPYIRIGMTTKKPLEFVFYHSQLGSITYDNRSQRSGFGYRQKGFYLWSISTAKRIPSFIKLILPYLVLKKPQAELMLHFCEEYQLQKYRRGGIPEEVMAFREKIYHEMSILNGHQRPQRLNPEASKDEAIV